MPTGRRSGAAGSRSAVLHAGLGFPFRRGPASQEEIDQRSRTLSSVFTGTGRAVITVITLVTLLPLAGVNITAIVTGFGITGLALALGAQALVRDTINGTFILFEDQYRKGDVVCIAEITGTIEEITLRRPTIRDDDGVLHSIPNGT